MMTDEYTVYSGYVFIIRHTKIIDIFSDFENPCLQAGMKFIGVLVDCKKKFEPN